MNLCIRYIDDADETFLNGKPVGKTGGMPSDKNGYFGGTLRTKKNGTSDAGKNIRHLAKNTSHIF